MATGNIAVFYMKERTNNCLPATGVFNRPALLFAVPVQI